ncbi:LppA family lipoprotein [Amycolatopsis sp. NPDC047767]|uniref:LppA family lipoprotein n=1 Tax=Amycolatopsis sp. NPDC047767 TaxID=3156765 RepID=UPI0034514B7D
MNLLVVLAVGSAAACGATDDSSGGNVNADTAKTFAALMQRPNIEDATQQYLAIDTELRQSLSREIASLKTWTNGSEGSRASCAADYPGIDADGVTASLASHIVAGNLPDSDYEKALTVIGTVAQKYGFTPQPQRLHDSPGSHDAIFHNTHDDGEISFGTAQNTSLRINLGCHLTAAAKKRGTPAPAPTD